MRHAVLGLGLNAVLALDAGIGLDAACVAAALLEPDTRRLEPDAGFVLVLCAVVLRDAVLGLDAALVLDGELALVRDTRLGVC